MGRYLSLTPLAFFLLLSCATTNVQRPSREGIPALAFANYSCDLDSRIQDRIVDAPAMVVGYLNSMDRTDAYKPHVLTAEERKVCEEYLGGLPEGFRSLLKEKAVGIYFIDNLAGGGLTEFIFDERKSAYVFLAFNPDTLKKSLSEWITYRDASSYEVVGGNALESRCGGCYLGFLHVLLHETGHVYDYYEGITLGFDDRNVCTAFDRGVWRDFSTPERGYDFKNRKTTSAYGFGGKQAFRVAIEQYRRIAGTPFTSIYGSRNKLEDFAETFAWYWINRKFGTGYEVVLRKNGMVAARYSPQENRLVLERYPQLESIE